MNHDDLGNPGDSLGGIGIIITLIELCHPWFSACNLEDWDAERTT